MPDRAHRFERALDAQASNLRTTILADRMGRVGPWHGHAKCLRDTVAETSPRTNPEAVRRSDAGLLPRRG